MFDPKVSEQGPIAIEEGMLMDVVFQHAVRFFMLMAQYTLIAKGGTSCCVGEDAIPVVVGEEWRETRDPTS